MGLLVVFLGNGVVGKASDEFEENTDIITSHGHGAIIIWLEFAAI